MELRKITIDNSVRYVSNGDYLHNKQVPQISNTRKKNAFNNKELSQKNKNFIKNTTGEGVGKIKWTTNCYFQSKSYK